MDGGIAIAIVTSGLVGALVAPALIAKLRQHPDRSLIYRLSALAVFSFALWLMLFVWAVADKRDDAVVSRYVAKLKCRNQLPVLITSLLGIGLIGVAISTFIVR